MALNFEEFRESGKKMVDYICDYMHTMSEKAVFPSIEPGYLTPLLADKMPDKPESYEKVMKDFESTIMPGMVHWNHPDFYAYFGSGNGYPSILADMLSDGVSAIGFSWASCPALTELETIMLDWYAKALHLPESFLSHKSNPKSAGCGTIQGSASDAIFSCMCSARARAIKKLKGNNFEIHDSVYLPQLVCYSSKEAHSSVEKAAKMNLVKIRVIEPDEHDSMRGAALEWQIKRDIEHGLTPFFVVGTLGTTSQVAFDNIKEIGEVCQRYPLLWFHADGAYGGNSFVVPEMRRFMVGLEMADSLEINPNKLLLTSFDCTCMWVKDEMVFTEAFAVDPLYLQHQHNKDVMDLRHFGIPLSRRFRALKLYFMFRMYGLERLQEFIRRVIRVGKHFEQLVLKDPRFEVMNDSHLGLVCFRLLQSDEVNQEFCARMNGSARIHLTPALVKGRYIVRFAAIQENCSEAQVEGAWNTIQEFAEDILSELKPQVRRHSLPTKYDQTHKDRYAFTRIVTKEIYDKQAKIQKLVDGATPIVKIETDELTPFVPKAGEEDHQENNDRRSV